MAQLTLLDMTKRTGSDREIGLIEDVVTFAPELGVIPVRPIVGTTFRSTLRTGYPTGAFRAAGAGVTPAKSTYAQKLAECFFFDTPLVVDEALPEAEDKSVGDILTDESIGAIRGAGISIASQFYYGTSADAKGFQGVVTYITGNTGFEVNAGTTSGGANTTSVYLVWLDLKGIHFIAGNTAAPRAAIGTVETPSGAPAMVAPPFQMPPWFRQQVTDPADSTKRFFAFVSNIRGWIGMAFGSNNSAFRVRNVGTGTATTTKPFTDTLGAQLLSLVPLHIRNSGNLRWFMNRTAAYGLQSARSFTSVTNLTPGMGSMQGGVFADLPKECQGIPIVITDSITNTETGI
jgi:hypothetical protein